MEVHLGVPSCGSNFESTPKRSVLEFIYELHQRLGLEANATETILLPKDEFTLFKFVLRESSAVVDDNLHTVWAKLGRLRVYGHVPDDTRFSSLITSVEEQLSEWNVVDRVSLIRRLFVEFSHNVELRKLLFDNSYVVCSRSLDWFEHLTLELITCCKCPNLSFPFLPNQESSFFNLRLCTSDLVPRYKKCVVTDALLGYMGLAVNLKDSVHLLRVINRPKRGLDRTAFASLHQLAKQYNLSAAQVALSFTYNRQLDTERNPHPLQSWATGLDHLVNCLTKCQDALAGILDDSALATSTADDRMDLAEARESVIQCIQTAAGVLRKPLIATKPCSGDEEYDAMFTESRIKNVTNVLCHKLVSLTLSSTELGCCDTPGRSLLFGGGLRGRAAKKLARFLLVFGQPPREPSVDSQKAGIVTSSDCCIRGVSSLSTPLGRLPSLRTPTTAGHGEEILAMFPSPSLSISASCGNEETKENSTPVTPTTSLRSSPDAEEVITMPEHPIFARYQCGLDWADAEWSPLSTRRFCERNAPLSDYFDAHSLPAWPKAIDVSRSGRDTSLKTFTTSSTLLTPVKSKSTSAGGPRTLFEERAVTDVSISRTGSLQHFSGPATSIPSGVRTVPSRLRTAVCSTKRKKDVQLNRDTKQRSLDQFFRRDVVSQYSD